MSISIHEIKCSLVSLRFCHVTKPFKSMSQKTVMASFKTLEIVVYDILPSDIFQFIF